MEEERGRKGEGKEREEGREITEKGGGKREEGKRRIRREKGGEKESIIHTFRSAIRVHYAHHCTLWTLVQTPASPVLVQSDVAGPSGPKVKGRRTPRRQTLPT